MTELKLSKSYIKGVKDKGWESYSRFRLEFVILSSQEMIKKKEEGNGESTSSSNKYGERV